MQEFFGYLDPENRNSRLPRNRFQPYSDTTYRYRMSVRIYQSKRCQNYYKTTPRHVSKQVNLHKVYHIIIIIIIIIVSTALGGPWAPIEVS
jgi:hypothetical protein